MRTETPKLRLVSLLAAVLGAALLACGSEEPAQPPPEDAATEVGAEEVVVDERGIVWGETQMPAGFPEDLPELEGAVVTSALAAGEAGTAVNLRTDMPVEEIYAFYAEALPEAGWQLVPGRPVAGHKVLSATKDNLTLVVSAAAVEGESRVALSVATGN